ncbi:aldolase [Patellaria atrata CBS 101060]|uniref:Aldolase n=1 Tax=Patellaria atrata CBS 101060 TaxID=1346257 RepID=A0A9P4VUL3_9PEZI|nr:aldolase [Patellaria atrata CBS 101060]
MATQLISEIATPTRLKGGEVVQVEEISYSEKPRVCILYNEGEESIVGLIAEILGQDVALVNTVQDDWDSSDGKVLGIPGICVGSHLEKRQKTRTIINTHCVDGDYTRNEYLSNSSDYEYLYTRSPYLRRDLTRFLSFILGQNNPHRDLTNKTRTTLISTTFPDVHAALPNLDILSVGADAVEIRVDLLKEPLPDGSMSQVPSIEYVGEQVMILRQRTELPIIYTTRCTNENGRFPMEDPQLFLKYLFKAIQWGCEYVDVELWLPEDIRRTLAERKGNSKIISAFHDFSGTFKWTSGEAHELFKKGAVYGDVVKMIALVTSTQENYELEYFRSLVQAHYKHPRFSGLNMGPMGQLSRTVNKIFTPITHPLLPMIAAPGQLSAAEINQALHTMGQMPKLYIYGIGSFRKATQGMFFEKCFNELSLPHQFIYVEKGPKGSVDLLMKRPNFGGAYINPPVSAATAPLPNLSEAARAIGQVDTVLLRSDSTQPSFIGDNATWKGIRATLSRDFVPSAYSGRAALILANAESDAAAAIFALKSLGIGPIYTIGFKTQGYLASEVQPVRLVEDAKMLQHPFVIISALPAEKSMLVGPLLKHYSDKKSPPGSGGKVFVDLASGSRKVDILSTAALAGWTAYGIADVTAWTTVETMRLLVGQNVPYDFVRLASGRSLY